MPMLLTAWTSWYFAFNVMLYWYLDVVVHTYHGTLRLTWCVTLNVVHYKYLQHDSSSLPSTWWPLSSPPRPPPAPSAARSRSSRCRWQAPLPLPPLPHPRPATRKNRGCMCVCVEGGRRRPQVHPHANVHPSAVGPPQQNKNTEFCESGRIDNPFHNQGAGPVTLSVRVAPVTTSFSW